MRTVIKANVQRRSVNINILGLGRTAPTSCKRRSLLYSIQVSQETDSEQTRMDIIIGSPRVGLMCDV